MADYIIVIIIVIAEVINLLALGGFAYLAKGWFTSLKGTVDAQQQTISALKVLLDATDTPGMLKRFESYRKLVDHEKQVLKEEIERNFLEMVSKLLPYTPIQERKILLESTYIDAALVNPLRRLAEEAPDASKEALARFFVKEFEATVNTMEEMSRQLEENRRR